MKDVSQEGEGSLEKVVEEPVEPIDFNKEVFDPFNIA